MGSSCVNVVLCQGPPLGDLTMGTLVVHDGADGAPAAPSAEACLIRLLQTADVAQW